MFKMGIIGTFEGSAESRLELFAPGVGAKNGFLNSPSRVNNSGNGHDDYEGYSSYGTLTTWIYQSGSAWHECLYRLSNDIILTPFKTITFTIDCFPCDYEGRKTSGNPAPVKRIGVGSPSMTSNSFSAFLDCPNEVLDGRYNVNISSLTGTFRFYIYMQVTGGGSRYFSGSRINLRECYLTA